VASGSLACGQPQPPQAPKSVVASEEDQRPPAELRGACGAGEVRACVQLARAYLRGSEGPPDLVKGVSFAREGCERGDTLGCAVLGQAEVAGFVPGATKEVGLARCERACGADSGFGCRCAATAYAKGFGAHEDFEKALVIAKKSCDLGDLVGCGVAASAQVKLDKSWTGAAARAFAKRGCDGGDDWSCSLAATSVVLDEKSTPAERKAAAAKLDTLCDTTEPSACAQLALAYQRNLLEGGDAVARMAVFAKKGCEKDPGATCSAFARSLMGGDATVEHVSLVGAMATRGCAANDGASCRWVGHVGRLRNEADAAIAGYKKGCALGDTPACADYASFALCGRGEWEPCRAELTRLCTTEISNGCAELARITRKGLGEHAADLGAALAFARRGCEGKAGDACVEAAGILAEQKQDGWEAESLGLLEGSCEATGYADACLRAGLNHLATGKKTPDEVLGEFDRACRAGSANGCGYYGVLTLGLVEQKPASTDLVLAIARAARSCERGSAVACWVDGRVSEHGVRGRTASLEEAFTRYRRACEGQPPFGCADAARVLTAGGAAATPDGVEKRDEVVRALLTAGCEVGKDKFSCEALAQLPKPPSGPARGGPKPEKRIILSPK
jgi:uncharacterized protein